MAKLTDSEKVKALKKAAREAALANPQPKGGRHQSARDKARKRNQKHAKRAKEDW